jgi:hypothetical protein
MRSLVLEEPGEPLDAPAATVHECKLGSCAGTVTCVVTAIPLVGNLKVPPSTRASELITGSRCPGLFPAAVEVHWKSVDRPVVSRE